ncbi:MAG: nucleoside hydrolase [Proteobacteria bacterium]|nr:nucleoside hydrolase [Pseudomonadota bacterium]
MLKRRQLLIAMTLMSAMPSAFSIPGGAAATEKILLDTDIGSDIDDAVALAFLLRHPACELMGITTVTGEPDRRARLAGALCQIANVKVPVLAGAAIPLVIPQRQTEAPQAEKIDTRDKSAAPSGEAIEFLRSTIRKHPGEITLLAIGPLTNIALLFRTDPEIPSMLKQLVVMAGKYSDYPTPWGPTEWNAIVDPHATHIVFNAPVSQARIFGLDITWQVSMDPEAVSREFSGDPLLETVRDWSEVWFRERDLLHFHDPLAAAAVFNPEVCRYKRGRINVELGDPATAGVTHFVPDPESPFEFAASVNADQFFREYFGVFRR